jgi:hypothetical protein
MRYNLNNALDAHHFNIPLGVGAECNEERPTPLHSYRSKS